MAARKRPEVRRRPTARERLLEHCDDLPFIPVWARTLGDRAKTRRLLRAVLVEASEAAVQAADLAFAEGRPRFPGDMSGLYGMSQNHRAAALSSIRAAILGRAKKGGRRA